MRRFGLFVLAVAVAAAAGCSTQEHHTTMDDQLRERVATALHATLVAQGTDPEAIRPRTLDWETNLIAHQARNADPAFAMIADGSMSREQLHEIARYAVSQLNDKRPNSSAPALLTFLLEDQREWDRGHRELTLGLINQMCADAKMALDNHDVRRLLDHALPPEQPLELKR